MIVSNIFATVTVDTLLSDFVIVVDKNGTEYVAIRNNDYMYYIIKDLKNYDAFVKEYEFLEDTYNKQKFYILELENKIKNADEYIGSLKNTINNQDTAINKMEIYYKDINKLVAMNRTEIEKYKKTLKERNRILTYSITLNILLTIIILL